MTRDARCAEAEAIVREQRGSTWEQTQARNATRLGGGLLLKDPDYLRHELARLQAAVMGESDSRGRDGAKSKVEVEAHHAGVICDDDRNTIGEFFPVGSPEWRAAKDDPSVSVLYVQETP